jgi:hypothetical protein
LVGFRVTVPAEIVQACAGMRGVPGQRLSRPGRPEGTASRTEIVHVWITGLAGLRGRAWQIGDCAGL